MMDEKEKVEVKVIEEIKEKEVKTRKKYTKSLDTQIKEKIKLINHLQNNLEDEKIGLELLKEKKAKEVYEKLEEKAKQKNTTVDELIKDLI